MAIVVVPAVYELVDADSTPVVRDAVVCIMCMALCCEEALGKAVARGPVASLSATTAVRGNDDDDDDDDILAASLRAVSMRTYSLGVTRSLSVCLSAAAAEAASLDCPAARDLSCDDDCGIKALEASLGDAAAMYLGESLGGAIYLAMSLGEEVILETSLGDDADSSFAMSAGDAVMRVTSRGEAMTLEASLGEPSTRIVGSSCLGDAATLDEESLEENVKALEAALREASALVSAPRDDDMCAYSSAN